MLYLLSGTHNSDGTKRNPRILLSLIWRGRLLPRQDVQQADQAQDCRSLDVDRHKPSYAFETNQAQIHEESLHLISEVRGQSQDGGKGPEE